MNFVAADSAVMAVMRSMIAVIGITKCNPVNINVTLPAILSLPNIQ
jgi:hypothetical protein